MTNNKRLRRLITNYLEHPRSMSLNQFVRAVRWSKPSYLKLLRGNDVNINLELERRIIRVVAPWELSPLIKAAEIGKKLMKDRRTGEEIRQFAAELAKFSNEAG